MKCKKKKEIDQEHYISIDKNAVHDVWLNTSGIILELFGLQFGNDFSDDNMLDYIQRNKSIRSPQEEVLILLAMKERIDYRLHELRDQYFRSRKRKQHKSDKSVQGVLL